MADADADYGADKRDEDGLMDEEGPEFDGDGDEDEDIFADEPA